MDALRKGLGMKIKRPSPKGSRTITDANGNGMTRKGQSMGVLKKESSYPSLTEGMKKNSSFATNTSGGMKKNISFGHNKIKIIEHPQDYNEEEQKNVLWFSTAEMNSMRSDVKNLLSKGDVTRGMEPYSNASTRTARLRHVKSILAIQEEYGAIDDIELNKLARSISAGCLRRAQRLADKDFEEANRLHAENLNPNLNSFYPSSSHDPVAKSKAIHDFASKSGLLKRNRRSMLNPNTTAISSSTLGSPSSCGLKRTMKFESSPCLLAGGHHSIAIST